MGDFKNKLIEFIERNESELKDQFIEQKHEEEFNLFCEDRFQSHLEGDADAVYERMREDQW